MTDPLPYYDPAGLSAVFYDVTTSVDAGLKGDVTFYQGLTRPGGLVLELGCGTGRVTFALAAAGSRVVGVDLAETMPWRASRQFEKLPADVQSRIALIKGDMTSVSIGARFDAVLITYYTLAHLPVGRWGEAFDNALRHMAPGAALAVHLPTEEHLSKAPPTSSDRTALTFTYTQAGDTLHVHHVSQGLVDGVFELVLDYQICDGSGAETRRSRERLTLHVGDPVPIAAERGMVLAREPFDCASGKIFVFKRAET